MQRQQRILRRPVVARQPLVSQDGLRLGQVPDEMRIAFQRYGALERLKRAPIVAPRLIGVADRVVGVEVRGVLRERAPLISSPLVVLARLLEEEAEHRLVLGLAGIGVEILGARRSMPPR